jgi:hypothetical protein
VGNLGNSLQVRNVVLGVTNALEVDGLCLVVDGSSNVLGLVAVDKLGLDAQTGEEDLELVVGAAVEVGGGDDVVAGVGQSVDGDELGGLAGGGGESSSTALESGYSLFKDIDRRLLCLLVNSFYSEAEVTHVHDTAVDVAKLLEAEKPRAVSRIIKDVALFEAIVSINYRAKRFGSRRPESCMNRGGGSFVGEAQKQQQTYSRGVDGDGSRVGSRIGLSAREEMLAEAIQDGNCRRGVVEGRG